MLYVIYISVVLVAFLVVLNGHLRGAWKIQFDMILSLLLVGLVIAAFVTSGWKSGLLVMGTAFVSAAIAKPIAGLIASRLRAH